MRRFRTTYSPSHRGRRGRGRFGGFIGAGLQACMRLLSYVRHHFIKAMFQGAVIVLALGVVYFLYLFFTLPDVSDPKSFFADQSTVITDRNGTELYRLFSDQDRTYVQGDQIPDHLKKAVVAIEDERYYERGCLDIIALARVALRFGSAGGGSTITRQLARNALGLRQDSLINRKLKEIILGCQMESIYTKDELLDLYLNWIPFGRNAYGIEQASKLYFGHSASGLTLAKSSILAALPQRPTYFNPYGSHVHTEVSFAVNELVSAGGITSTSQIEDNDVTIGLIGTMLGTGSNTLYIGGRTDQILQNMIDQGYIGETEKQAALDELQTLEFQASRDSIRAPHFSLWVREQVENMFTGTSEEGLLERGGLTIRTTLDWDLQQAAEKAVENNRENILSLYGANNIALVALDPDTRDVLAYVGNMDYSDTENGGKIDMVQAPRQPGSSFKPFVYAGAFEEGYSPATVLYDVPTKIGQNEPQNFDGKFMGLMSMRQALGASRNVPAAKAFFLAGGEDNILQLVSTLGVTSPLTRRTELDAQREEGFGYGWPLALGAAETPLIEMAHGYSTLADEGVYKDIVSIDRITDKLGNILYETERDPVGNEVIDRRIAYQVTSMLSDESVRPEEYWRTQLTVPGFQTAAKTGTSNKCLEWKDENTCRLRKPDNAWLMGYTPELVAGVWVGNADSTAMFDKAGGLNTASPIWRDFMIRAHKILDIERTQFKAPPGIVQPQVSLLSGQLPTSCTPVNYRRADVFLAENAPSLPDPACGQLEIDKVTGLLASDSCPVEARESGSFIIAKSILPNRWPKWEQGVQEWVAGQMEVWNATPDHSGAIIPLPIAPTEQCDIRQTPGRQQKPEVEIISPAASRLASYPAFTPQLDVKVGSEVREVRYYIDGKLIESVTSSPFAKPLRVPRSVRQEGDHVFKVIIIDEYYNEASDSTPIRFGKDEKAPSVEILTPFMGQNVQAGSTVRITAKATDTDGGIKYIQFYWNDVLLSTKPKSPYSMEYTIPADVPSGTYTIRAVAEDLAEHTSSDEVEVFVSR